MTAQLITLAILSTLIAGAFVWGWLVARDPVIDEPTIETGANAFLDTFRRDEGRS